MPEPITDRWLIADSAWSGPGQWLDACALPVAGGVDDAGEFAPFAPVPIAELPPGAPTAVMGGTLLPGLRDAHGHAGLIELAALRRGGIAALHDLGGVPAELARLRRARPGTQADPDGLPVPLLPRLEIAGAFLTVPGGYPSDRGWAATGSWRELRSPGDAEAAVGEQLAAGATRIKVTLNANAGPVPDAYLLAAVVAAAHTAGVEVVAHTEGVGMVRAALTAGIDQLAHVPWSEPLEPGLLRSAARHQSGWISTLDIHGRGKPSPALQLAVYNLRGFLEFGGRVKYGTDLGNGPLPLGVNPREIDALLSAGMSVDDVLVAMTTDGKSLAVADQVTWLPAGLDRSPEKFAQSLTRARVIALEEGSA
jgi:hypothetical protein